MAENYSASTTDASSAPQAPEKLPAGWLSTWPWITFLLPFIVYMVAGSFEPKPPTNSLSQKNNAESVADQTLEGVLEPETSEGAALENGEPGFFAADPGSGLIPAISYRYYPHVYTVKIALTLFTMLLVCPGYRTFPLSISGLSIAVGAVGVVLWIVLCQLRLEPQIIGPIDEFFGGLVNMLPGLAGAEKPSIGLMSMLGTGERSAFNPLEQMADRTTWAYAFLAIRFVGLALVVPVIEEFFLRGFIMRYLQHPNWWQVPFGSVSRAAVIAGTAIPMLMHPGELLASLVWFSLVTWLMVRTKNIWDCVAAHAVTNFLLGVYVVWSGEWQLM